MKVQTEKQFFGMDVERRVIDGTSFVCPKDIWPGLKRIFEGSYDLSPQKWRPRLPDTPQVLDLGANVGSFAIFARHRWYDSVIHSYEPDPDMYRMLLANTAHMPWSRTIPHDVTIGAKRETRTFHRGVDTASGSFYDNGIIDGVAFDVDVVPACDLHTADIIKVDIEGAEWEFLDGYRYLHEASYVAIEYHRDISERQMLIDRLAPMGFVMVKEHMEHDRPGELIFVKKDDLVV